MAIQPRILASNEPLIEARRKSHDLKWRDMLWIVPAMALGLLAGHIRDVFPLAYIIAGWCVAIFLLTGLVAVLNGMRRERRIWPHRFSRFGYVPITYIIVFLAFYVIGGAIELIRHLVLQ